MSTLRPPWQFADIAPTTYNSPPSVDGIITSVLPVIFQDKICTGHWGKGWTANPLGEEYTWVCGTCMKPSRIALIACIICAHWRFDMRTEHQGTDRENYICGVCRGNDS